MKLGLGILSFFLLLLMTSHAVSFESCSIDEDRVIVYKVINWWYDCLEVDSRLLCGKNLRCSLTGQIDIRYNPKKQTLILKLDKGLGELISIGAVNPIAGQLNPDFFGKAKAGHIRSNDHGIREIGFQEVPPDHADKLKRLQGRMMITLTGMITGLKNGKLALDSEEDFIRSCPASDKKNPIVLTLTLSETKERLARFRIGSGLAYD